MRLRGVSTVLAAVLLVVLVAGAAVLYYAMTTSGNQPGSASSSSSLQSTTSVEGPSVSCVSGGGGTVTVDASYNGGFSPSTVSISAGQSVTWKNVDTGYYTYYHTLTSATAGFNVQQINPGQSYTCTFHQAGTFSYHCSNHPFMTGTVDVSQ